MQRLLQEIVFFSILLCVNSRRPAMQGKPESCDRPAEFMYLQCCVFPPFFTREIAKVCGAIFAVNFIDKEHNVTAFTRSTLSSGCDHWRCVLNKYGFVTGGGQTEQTLDDEKYFNHLEKWAQLNPAFTSVLTNAQVYCKNIYRMFMPLTVCEFYKMHECIRNFVTLDCPAVFPSKECKEKKLFYDQCREYFL